MFSVVVSDPRTDSRWQQWSSINSRSCVRCGPYTLTKENLTFLYQNVCRSFVWTLLETKYHTFIKNKTYKNSFLRETKLSKALTSQETKFFKKDMYDFVVHAAMQVQYKYID